MLITIGLTILCIYLFLTTLCAIVLLHEHATDPSPDANIPKILIVSFTYGLVILCMFVVSPVGACRHLRDLVS